MCISKALIRHSCKSAFAKMGKISSNNMPGVGKSGNCLRLERSLILRLESWVVPAVAEEESLPLEASAETVDSDWDVLEAVLLADECESSWASSGRPWEESFADILRQKRVLGGQD